MQVEPVKVIGGTGGGYTGLTIQQLSRLVWCHKATIAVERGRSLCASQRRLPLLWMGLGDPPDCVRQDGSKVDETQQHLRQERDSEREYESSGKETVSGSMRAVGGRQRSTICCTWNAMSMKLYQSSGWMTDDPGTQLNYIRQAAGVIRWW
mgnify:CR=1 FL=1